MAGVWLTGVMPTTVEWMADNSLPFWDLFILFKLFEFITSILPKLVHLPDFLCHRKTPGFYEAFPGIEEPALPLSGSSFIHSLIASVSLHSKHNARHWRQVEELDPDLALKHSQYIRGPWANYLWSMGFSFPIHKLEVGMALTSIVLLYRNNETTEE